MMVNLDRVKKLCEEHDKCLNKIGAISYAQKQRIWIKVIDAKGNYFYLDDDELEMLNNFIENKKLDAENQIEKMFGTENAVKIDR